MTCKFIFQVSHLTKNSENSDLSDLFVFYFNVLIKTRHNFFYLMGL